MGHASGPAGQKQESVKLQPTCQVSADLQQMLGMTASSQAQAEAEKAAGSPITMPVSALFRHTRSLSKQVIESKTLFFFHTRAAKVAASLKQMMLQA